MLDKDFEIGGDFKLSCPLIEPCLGSLISSAYGSIMNFDVVEEFIYVLGNEFNEAISNELGEAIKTN